MIARLLLIKLTETFLRQLKESDHMTPALEFLATQVTRTKDVVGSAVTLIQGLASQIHAAKDDPAAIAALAQQLHDASDALAAAVAANTPAPDPTPAPTPDPTPAPQPTPDPTPTPAT